MVAQWLRESRVRVLNNPISLVTDSLTVFIRWCMKEVYLLAPSLDQDPTESHYPDA